MEACEEVVEPVHGRYATERVLGRGGLGVVWLARDLQLARWVAIKRIRPDTVEAGERARAALAEAQKLASLQHPNIVTVFDIFESGGEMNVVMEYVHGYTLESLEAPLPLAEFREIARQALEGLGAAHAAGMVHRDIKPSNVMLAAATGGKFQVKIMDFGLAKIQHAPSHQTTDPGGAVLGSIHTMAPEQFEQVPLDARADLYALGCVFYRSLTLREPFEGESVAAVIQAHLSGAHAPLGPLRPDLPPSLCRWVESLLERDRDRRPASAHEAAEALARASVPAASGRPAVALPPATKAAKPPWLPISLVVAAIVVLAALTIPKPGGKEKEVVPESPVGLETPQAQPSPPVASDDLFAPTDRAALLERTGRPAAVKGVIARVGENKAGTIRFLNFEGASREDLCLVFFLEGAREDFSGEALGKYVGRTVTARGKVSTYRGNPQIEISSLSQITED